jgi:hypothetical protein
LGSAVLVYAFLTSGALLSVALGWPEAVNGALWLVYVLGGIGLIRGKGWGRALTLLAAGGSLIAMVVFLIAGGIEHVYVSTVWSLFGLPALAILVSAMLVKLPPSKEVEVPPPTGTARKPKISKRALHDIAYISFMVLGLIAIWTSYWAYVDPDPGVIGFLVIIPFGIPLLLALILGPGLSMILWRDVRLLTLTMLSIAMLIALELLRVKDLPIPLSIYAAVCMTISLAWFVKYRRRFG